MNSHEGEESKTQEAAKPSSGMLKSGVSASEAGKKGVQAKRERAAQRAAAQEHDRLTVQARLALALAAKLTYADLQAIIDSTIAQAKQADGHVQIQAARTVLAWAEVAAQRGGDADDDVLPEGSDLAAMTPEQRAVYRSVREKALEEMAALAQGDDDDTVGA